MQDIPPSGLHDRAHQPWHNSEIGWRAAQGKDRSRQQLTWVLVQAQHPREERMWE